MGSSPAVKSPLDFLLADIDTPAFELPLPLVLITVVPSSSSSLFLPFLDFFAYDRMEIVVELLEGTWGSGREARMKLGAKDGAR